MGKCRLKTVNLNVLSKIKYGLWRLLTRDVQSEKRREIREAEPGQNVDETVTEEKRTEKGTKSLSITQDAMAVQVDGIIP